MPGGAAQFVSTQINSGFPPSIQTDGRNRCHPGKVEPSKVMSIGEPVERHIEVGPGIGAQGDKPNLEGDARAVDLFRSFATQMVGNHWRWQTGIGQHAVSDHMAQVNKLHEQNVPRIRRRRDHCTVVIFRTYQCIVMNLKTAYRYPCRADFRARQRCPVPAMDNNTADVIAQIEASIALVPAAVVVSRASDRGIVATNQEAQAMFGFTAHEMRQRSITDLTDSEWVAELSANYAQSTAPEGLSTIKRYRRSNGASFMAQVRAIVCALDDDYRTAAITDLAAIDHLRTAVSAAASTDSLTGTLRREAFLDAARLSRSVHPFYGLLFIDVDGLKPINDTLGHMAGDELLQTVARRLSSRFRQGDLVGRFGGDEFVVFVNDLPSADELARLAELLIEKLSSPIESATLSASPSASIGAVFCTNEVPITLAVARADRVMYAAKRRRQEQGRHGPVIVEEIH